MRWKVFTVRQPREIFSHVTKKNEKEENRKTVRRDVVKIFQMCHFVGTVNSRIMKNSTFPHSRTHGNFNCAHNCHIQGRIGFFGENCWVILFAFFLLFTVLYPRYLGASGFPINQLTASI